MPLSLNASAKRIRQEVLVDPPSNLTELQRAIYEVGAPILHAPDVKKYQEKARRRKAVSYWVRRHGLPGAGVFCVTAASGFLAWLALSYALSGGGWWARCLFGMLLGSSCFGSLLTFLALRPAGPMAQWAHRSLYDWQVVFCLPEEVVERAERILARCPQVVLTVEFLVDDPFLVAEHKGERLYIAVWDEGKFIQ